MKSPFVSILFFDCQPSISTVIVMPPNSEFRNAETKPISSKSKSIAALLTEVRGGACPIRGEGTPSVIYNSEIASISNDSRRFAFETSSGISVVSY